MDMDLKLASTFKMFYRRVRVDLYIYWLDCLQVKIIESEYTYLKAVK